MQLPVELNFLERHLLDGREKYEKPSWLVSDFHDYIWYYDFGYDGGPKRIDWRVMLDDGESLVEKKNENLLLAFKYWLAFSETDNRKSPESIKVSFHATASVIDYILDRSAEFVLSKHGIECLNRNDMIALLEKRASSYILKEGLHDWSQRVSEYYFQQIKFIGKKSINKIISEYPFIATVDPYDLENTSLTLSREIIPSARAVSIIKNIVMCENGGAEFNGVRAGRYNVNSSALTALLYPNTILLKNSFGPRDTALGFDVGQTHRVRELEPAPVSSRGKNKESVTTEGYTETRQALYRVGQLHSLQIPAPSIDDLSEIAQYTPSLKKKGRYSTIPSSVFFDSIKNAIEFHFEYGAKLLTSYVSLVKYSIVNRITLREISTKNFNSLIDPILKDVGLKGVGISAAKRTGKGRFPTISSKVYFEKLRSNEGLLELIVIYFSAIQITMGAVMARRIGELLDLVSNECLDHTKKWLLFENRKSTQKKYGTRNTIARPVEPVVVEMIEGVVLFQSQLIELGVIEKYTYLFSRPKMDGELKLVDPSGRNSALGIDLFCDYFRTGTDSNGCRYYIRQHQLRRFYALLFFYSSSFGGVETLQWMLGHSSLLHIWHYITESTDGSVLRGAKAQYIAESIHRYGVENYECLSSLLEERYGTSDFSIIETSDLEEFITSLLIDGKVEIEPYFFVNEKKEKMKIVVKVTGNL